jgi:hypothetical protein
LFAGRYENASDIQVLPVRSRKNPGECGLGFIAGRDGKENRRPDSCSGKRFAIQKKSGKNFPGKSPGNHYPDIIARKKTGKNINKNGMRPDA